MITKFRWSDVTVTVDNIFEWTFIVGLLLSFNLIYFLFVSCLLLGTVMVYVKRYVKGGRQADETESAVEEVLWRYDRKVELLKRWRAIVIYSNIVAFIVIWIVGCEPWLIAVVFASITVAEWLIEGVLKRRMRKLENLSYQ